MGISGSKKTKTTNEPWAPAQPYIIKGLEQSGQVFDQQQPFLNKYSQEAFGAYGRMAPGAEAGIRGSQSLVNDTLAGKFLGGNPYTDAIIAKNAGDIRNNVGAAFSGSGRYGSGMFGDTIADNIGEMATNLRYGDYAQERQNQIGAVDQAQGLMAGSQGLLNNAAELPWIGVGALNGNVRNASGGYGTSTSKTSGGLGSSLLGGAFTLGSAALSNPAIMASDERVKQNKKKIGEMGDGLGVYSYEYKPELDPTGQPQVGVMAQEVAQKRPEALGPTLDNGMMTVDYGALQQDIPDIPKPGQGYLERLLNPDMSTTGGLLAAAGQHIGASLGDPIGRGLLSMRRDKDAAGDAELEREYLKSRIDGANQPELVNVPGVGLVRKYAGGKYEIVERAEKDTRTSLLKEMEAAGIDPKSPEGRLIIARSATGYGYSDEAQAQKIETERELARIRADSRAPTGQLGAGDRAKYISEAEAAIARGAPRDKVYARLRQMGVN